MTRKSTILCASILTAALAAPVCGSAQTTLFSEDFGTPSSKKDEAIADHVWNAGNEDMISWTIGTSGNDNLNVRSNNASDYDGASASGNLYFKGDATFTVTGIDTDGYTDLKLSFGIFGKNDGDVDGLTVSYSADGGAATSIGTMSALGATATADAWTLLSGIAIPSAKTITLTFSCTLDGALDGGIRIDDVTLTGVASEEEPDYTGVLYINEVCGKQDPDDDWVELYNASSSAIDMEGLMLVKIDEEGSEETIFTFPAGSSIAANGYLVVATLTGELQAGISNTKQVGLKLVNSRGNGIDSFDRDSDVGRNLSHTVGGSYARIPDGTGDWRAVKAATRGTANSDAGSLYINEVCGLQDPDDDWIELYNGSSATIDLAGAYIVKTDEDGKTKTIYTFPEGSSIGSCSYLVVATLTDELQAGISNKKQVGLELFSADGTSIDSFDRDSDLGSNATHASGGSYCRFPDGSANWTVTRTATRGAANKKIGDVVINEVCGLQDPDDDWIELYNNSDDDIVLDDAYIVKTDEDGLKKKIFTFPLNSTISGNGYLVVATLTGELQAGISNKKQVGLELFSADDTSMDSFDRDYDLGSDATHASGGSYARVPNGTGDWAVAETATRGTDNDSAAGAAELISATRQQGFSLKGNVITSLEGTAMVYAIDGRLAAIVAANASAGLAPGVYVVRTSATATKILVK